MRVMIFSNNFDANFGYSIVASRLALELIKQGYEVVYYNMNGIIRPNKDVNGIHQVGHNFDALGSDSLENDLKSYRPDVFISICDIWMSGTRYMHGVLKKFPEIRWIHHATVNSQPLSPILESSFIGPDVLVAPSVFAYNELRPKFQNVIYIPHGVDLNIFRPMDVSELKKELGFENKFVFLFVGRNKSGGMQKNIQALIYAYKIFCNSVKDSLDKTVLYMMSDPLEPDGLRYDFLKDKLGIGDNVKIVKTKVKSDLTGLTIASDNDECAVLNTPNRNLPQEEMAKLYNISDCFVIASEGESFCLPMLEAMACGKPVIAPTYSAMSEHIINSNAGLGVPIAMTYVNPLISEVGLVSYEMLASAMVEMYQNEERRKQFSENAIKYAEKFSWDLILPKWIELIENINKKRPLNYAMGDLGI